MNASEIRQHVQSHQRQLTKPPESLGKLEQLVEALAVAQDTVSPQCRPAAVILFACDHPVALQGVSAFPQAVTRAMVKNFVSGGAAAAVLSRNLQLPLSVVDVGVEGGPIAELANQPMYLRSEVAEHAEGDVTTSDAMSPETFAAAWKAGERSVDSLGNDTRVLVLGEMGIGNSTLAGIVAAGCLDLSLDTVIGRGTGVNDQALEKKRAVIETSLKRIRGATALEVLRRGGGREMVALAAAATRASQRNMAVLVDGIIVTASVAAAVKADASVGEHLIFAHQSDDASHAAMLHALKAAPLLNLSMRLGEASGALVAFPILEAACHLHAQMATFTSAQVPDKA
jgi:nicotinate-nucleotide--dimethylbenzimidazole phosphoribosyltransferase